MYSSRKTSFFKWSFIYFEQIQIVDQIKTISIILRLIRGGDTFSCLGDYMVCPLFYKAIFSMCLVNNMSPGTEEAITGEKSLPALTTAVLRHQVFGWVIK